MRTVLSITSFLFLCFCFIACGSEEQQNGTNQNASNTLSTLLNPNANSAAATTTSATPGLNTLQDIWVLAMINSEQKYEVNLVNNTPLLDLDSAKSRMTGYTGCNSLTGKLKVRGNKLVFDSLRLTSSQPCNDKGFEKKLVSSLKGGNTTYKIDNDTLHLSIGGAELIYRRIRRGT